MHGYIHVDDSPRRSSQDPVEFVDILRPCLRILNRRVPGWTDDDLQDMILLGLEARRTYRPDQGAWYSWLVTHLQNFWPSQMPDGRWRVGKSDRHREPRIQETAWQHFDWVRVASNPIQDRESRIVVEDFLARYCSPLEAEAIRMHVYEDLSAREISRRTGNHHEWFRVTCRRIRSRVLSDRR